MCVTGKTQYEDDLESMSLALSNLGTLKELVIDLSESKFDEEKDAEFLKGIYSGRSSGFISQLLGEVCLVQAKIQEET